MTHELVLCECACGCRIAFPVSIGESAGGFACDNCFAQIRFEGAITPSRIELTDEDGTPYALGLHVFSMIRSNSDLAEEVIRAWFGHESVEVERVSESSAELPVPGGLGGPLS